jgi:hypothetical protein
MKQKNGIPHLIVGSVLFIVGGYLAYSFYDYDSGIMEATPWDSVIIFSVISVLGLVIFVYGAGKILKNKRL